VLDGIEEPREHRCDDTAPAGPWDEHLGARKEIAWRRDADDFIPPGTAMIKKISGKYVVLSETTGRRFGTYETREEAEKRLRQIEMFKHMRTGKGARRRG